MMPRGVSPDPREESSRPTVLVVGDHELVRTSLVVTFQTHGIAAQPCPATDLTGVLAEAARLVPGLVILDLDLGFDDGGRHINGSAAVRELRVAGWSVLIVSGSGDRTEIAAAIAAGAMGEVPKSAPFETLVGVVADAVAGRQVMSEQVRRSWLELDRQHRVAAVQHRRRINRLTPREWVVLDRLAEGHRAVAIADEFVVSVATVRSQIKSILAKLEVNSQLEAVSMVRGSSGQF